MRLLRWSLSYIAGIFALAILFIYLEAALTGVADKIYANRYTGEAFIYWFLYIRNFYLLIIPVGFLVLLVDLFIQHRKFQVKEQKYFLHRTALAVLLMVITLSIAITFFIWFIYLEEARIVHLASVQIADKTFHVGVIAFIGGDRFVIYECDRWGILCTVAHTEADMPYLGTEFDTLQVFIDPLSDKLEFEIDGKVVYTYPNDSNP
jgi:hypothetical protein